MSLLISRQRDVYVCAGVAFSALGLAYILIRSVSKSSLNIYRDMSSVTPPTEHNSVNKNRSSDPGCACSNFGMPFIIAMCAY